MASDKLKEAVQSYDNYIEANGLEEKVIDACVDAVSVALRTEKDIPYGLALGEKVKQYIFRFIKQQTQGGDFKWLEEYIQERKIQADIINKYYRVLLLEAPHKLDSFKLYIEKNRPRKERFYEPRRRTLLQLTNAVQKLENDELDELFLHTPARVGKTQDITMDTVWHCARDMMIPNLYVTYKEGLGGAFLEGMQQIITDPTYCFADVFPDCHIIDTDAKNNKMDLGRSKHSIKKYKSISGKGLESGLNGEYDAYGWLIIDDILEGVQDVMSPDILKRKRTIFDNNVLTRKKEQCKIIWEGTIWSLHDIYMNRMEFLETNPMAKDIRYEVIKIPALDPETDESNFDYDYGVGFTTQHYRLMRAKFEENDDMAGWWAQCQQEPIERGGAVFNPEHMRYYNGVLPETGLVKVVGHCDTALGGGDYVSFPVAYVYEDEDGNESVYIHDVVFDNSEKHVTEPQVVAIIKKHNILNVHFESNQGGEGFKDDVAAELKKDKSFNGGHPINITSSWAPANVRKDQRIWDRAESIRQFYFLDAQHRHVQYRKFMQNLFSFQMNMRKRAHDDAPDSLAGLVDYLIDGSGRKTAVVIPSIF